MIWCHEGLKLGPSTWWWRPDSIPWLMQRLSLYLPSPLYSHLHSHTSVHFPPKANGNNFHQSVKMIEILFAGCCLLHPSISPRSQQSVVSVLTPFPTVSSYKSVGLWRDERCDAAWRVTMLGRVTCHVPRGWRTWDRVSVIITAKCRGRHNPRYTETRLRDDGMEYEDKPFISPNTIVVMCYVRAPECPKCPAIAELVWRYKVWQL